MKWTWPAWRLIEAKRATFTEISEKMTLTDIMKLNDAIEVVAEAQYKLQKKLEKNR